MAEIFSTPDPAEAAHDQKFLNRETIGGLIIFVAALCSLLLANSSFAPNFLKILETEFSVFALHFTIQEFIGDFLMAIFFAVAGAELRREFTIGSLNSIQTAAVPITAAASGMLVPALIYVSLGGSKAGWAIPTATDLPFCLAILAIFGRALPSALRGFLLSLAIADDLGAILIIAIFFSSQINWIGIFIAIFFFFAAYLLRKSIFIVLPGLLAWYFLVFAGIHGTVAGLVIGLFVHQQKSEKVEQWLQPISTYIVLPLFALSALAIQVSNFSDPLSQNIAIARVIGKPIGILLGAWLVARFTKARLNPEIGWLDVATIGVLCGIGFSVALLVSEISLSTQDYSRAASGLVYGALISGVIAALLLILRSRKLKIN